MVKGTCGSEWSEFIVLKGHIAENLIPIPRKFVFWGHSRQVFLYMPFEVLYTKQGAYRRGMVAQFLCICPQMNDRLGMMPQSTLPKAVTKK